MKKQPTTLYVVRHGTTALNQQYCFQGWIDEPLNDLGLAQGACLYERFKNIPIDLAVSSPLQRAYKTMELLLGDRLADYEIRTEPGLKELYGGAAEGMRFQELNAVFPDFSKNFSLSPGTVQMPEGESSADVEKRVCETFYRLAEDNAGKTIVATMHGFALSVWINHCMGKKVEEMQGVSLENVAVSKFSFDENNQVSIDYIGDADHLPEDLRENYDWQAINQARPKPIFLCYPKCSTCKKAKKYLEDHQIEVVERHIVEKKLRPSELSAIMSRFEGKDRQMFNTSGMKYRELGLKDRVKDMNRDEIIELLATDGMLVKRPMLIMPEKVLVGFKEAQWAEALAVE